MDERETRSAAFTRPPEREVPVAGGAATLTLVEEVRHLAVSRVEDRLAHFFAHSESALLDLADKALNNRDQRLAFEALRVVSLQRKPLDARFREEFASGLTPASKATARARATQYLDDDLSLKDQDTVEETIAMSNIEVRAEGLCRRQLWELGRRFGWLIENRGPVIAPEGLWPAALCRAFRTAVDERNTELAIRLLIFQVFDKLCMRSLAPFYDELLQLLIERGVWARSSEIPRREPGSRSSVRAAPPAARPPGAGLQRDGDAPGDGRATGGSSGHPGIGIANDARYEVDARTMSMLNQVGDYHGGGARPAAYTDANLALDLCTMAQGQPVPGWTMEAAGAAAQRVSLVGQLFNELLDEPNLPPDFMEQLDPLRFAVIKSALGDPAFFTDATHPVRQLVNEVALLASIAKTLGSGADRRIETLASQIQSQFEQPAERARQASERAQRISYEQVEQFVAQQVEQVKARRWAIIARVRETVSAELKLRTAGVEIPGSMQPLLSGGWAVIMAFRLTHDGMGSAPWLDGVQLLESILDLLGSGITPEREADHRHLNAELRRLLVEARVDSAKIDAMLAGFEQTLAAVTERRRGAAESEAGAGTAERKTEPAAPLSTVYITNVGQDLLLDLLMVPGRWFQLLDRSRDERRWLKYVGRSKNDEARLVFTEFNGRNPLEVSAEELIEDLIAHRSEPIDAPPACLQALDAAIAKREREAA
ncbi:MAG: hypothetical protein NVS9B10_21490 [Nevskia sp.]